MPSLHERKIELRDIAARTRRDAANGNDIGDLLRDRFFQAISVPAGQTVSGYWPIGDEANVMTLLKELGSRDLTLALPVVTPRGQPLIFRRWRPDDTMAAGPFNIQEPLAESPALFPDVMLIPLLAFDRQGGRLGYGGGYFDRSIVKLRQEKSVQAIGIAYAAQEVEQVPCDETDVRLDWIVSEVEAIDVERSRK